MEVEKAQQRVGRETCHTESCRVVNNDLDLISTWRPLSFLSGLEKKIGHLKLPMIKAHASVSF